MTGRGRNRSRHRGLIRRPRAPGRKPLQRVEIWPTRRQAPGPDGTLGGMRFCPIAAQEEPVAEVPTDVAFRQLVQEQVTVADVALLYRGEGRDDEAVADVDVEL